MLRKENNHSDSIYIVKEYWWILLFISFTFSGFMYAASSQKKIAEQMQEKIKDLRYQKILAEQERDYFLQKIESRDDPDFIMMTLIKVTGVTPKGQQKVIFEKVE